MQQDQRKKNSPEMDFFTEYGDANRYKIQEVVGKGSYGVVCSAIDTHTGGKVAIKKIHDIFEHISDAARILREIKLLRLLRHPDIVEIKHIMLPPSRRDFKDIYVVFELMESDLHQVIKANDDLTKEHYQFFLYQLLRALKYIHTANVYHRDLKPKNILANANCKLKICDFGLARVAFSDTPTTIFWTDYVATRWYRAPELCGSFFSKYTPAIDIWGIGCIFAEVLTGKPLFPGKNVAHQLDLMTDVLGTPSLDTISRVRNEKARRYLSSMRKKLPIPFSQKFPNADPSALKLLERLLAFDPKDRPTAEEALADPYFKGLSKVEREPSCQPITKMEFEFERRRVTKEDIRELIFREILEYHPQLLKDYINGTERTNFLYPSAVDQFKRQFAHLEENGGKSAPVIPLERNHVSLPRSSVVHSTTIPPAEQGNNPRGAERIPGHIGRVSPAPQRIPVAKPGKVVGPVMPLENGSIKDPYDPRRLIRNAVPPLQPCLPPAYCFHRTASKSASKMGAEVEDNARHPQPCMPSKVAPDIAIDMRASPFFLLGASKPAQSERTNGIDANILEAKPIPYVGIAVAAASVAHRKVGASQFGMSGMY
ncbi:mitogen-activated protein kinase 10 isoform X1 [Dendrobium catenatum]|uniref:mitogen-activated protein kinase n=1 Tax=Dendrobium catenatum TaxID=906689 RepID=A0A2I0W3W8_9ASPA|nr:mitogen-activated protein kinase 10 isoform X1 [Dendrobium catenatum]XP_020702153.1 mitogen-activated protein kinase 10 isoform X1 [Dendrobium catenatum]PKU70366.1 Mitogen-activated protein kinase 10 [Dendrobium catenatum]